MSKAVMCDVSELKLDLTNFRTVPQGGEIEAISAMIAIEPERFWALMHSLLDDGYLHTENILVLKSSSKDLIVKEGNRRVAALKIISDIIPGDGLGLPDEVKTKLEGLSEDWKTANEKSPCLIYPQSEAAAVDKIIARAHGKGEKAGRDPWSAVAKARHNRDVNNGIENGLDLLESYLKHGKNLTSSQKERWSGSYPITVLDEAIKRSCSRLGLSSRDLVQKYPSKNRAALESMMLDIGNNILGFPQLRAKNSDYGVGYGLPALTPPSPAGSTTGSTGSGGSAGTTGGTSGGAASTSTTGKKGAASAGTSKAAQPTEDPKSVKEKLKNFKPVGNNREKVASLVKEASLIDISKTPMAFSFLLRSMFEISAKSYCDDNSAAGGPAHINAAGEDRRLKDVLDEVVKFMTNKSAVKKNKELVRKLHGAGVELGKPDALLSVTSMNQLVHSQTYSITIRDLCVTFGNIFPLLVEMNS